MSKNPFVRPSFIGWVVVDPFDGYKLFEAHFRYSPIACSEGEYRECRELCIQTAKMVANNQQRQGMRPPMGFRNPRVILQLT